MGEEEEDRISAAMARALEQEERDVEAIEREFGRLTVFEAAARMRHSDNLGLVASLRRRGRLLAYRRRGQDTWWYPPFQYAENGGVLSVIPKLLEVAAAGRVDPMDLTFWLCSPTGMLEDDARPVDLLRSHPDAVLEAAQYDLGEHVW
ncbi:hypothetical protein [Sinomonas sp. G460-2]|uniref:hypothetical protein n=1 Tax=Sinomonas sp. G460-2 TaxID=3393464 RepID=UPI0039F0109B